MAAVTVSDSSVRLGRVTPVRAAALTVVLSLAWILPHLAHPRKVPDRGDPVFSAWRLASLAHQLAGDPRHLFDGNIFFPRQWTLA